MKKSASDARIDKAIEEALNALLVLGERVDLDLVEAARERLHRENYRFVSLHEGAPALEGALNLRLVLSHTELSPLEVGRVRAERAGRAVATLDQLERDLALSIEDPRIELVYRTVRTLEPPPPFTGAPLDEIEPALLASLVSRWELEREHRPPLLAWIRAKAKQHLQFYRLFASYPLYAARTRRIRALLPASLQKNASAIETFSAIEELGPVLDNFVFDRGFSSTFRDEVGVADLVFLLMQLADELVDNLVKLGGESALSKLLDEHFHEGSRGGIFIPFETLEGSSIRAAGIDEKTLVSKYGISVEELLALIVELRSSLLKAIDKASDSERIRAEVRAFFHHCFATFLDELELPKLAGSTRLDRLPRASVAWHFHRKNDDVMASWLALRARLLGLDPRDMPELLARWGKLLASFQIFDDLKDIPVDLGHQPSYPIAFAHQSHPRELAFLEKRLHGLERSIDRNEVMELAVHAPNTVRDCLRLGRLMALSSFDWFLEYVADYRWRRNFFVRARSFHLEPRVDVPIESHILERYEGAIDSGVAIIDAIFRYLAATEDAIGKAELDDETLGFVLDVIGYDHGDEVLATLFPRIPTMYRFLNLRMRMTSKERAEVLRLVVASHPRAAERALAGLRSATGSDTLAHRVARAFDLALPARHHALPASI